MLYVNDDNSIRLTRGDTARILVPITNDLTGTTYELTDSDKLTLTIKKKRNRFSASCTESSNRV